MQPLIKKCSSLFNVYLVLVKQMLMLYQNALVLFGFLVIYYKTICCEVNLERRGKKKKNHSGGKKERERKWFDRERARDRGKDRESEAGESATAPAWLPSPLAAVLTPSSAGQAPGGAESAHHDFQKG